MKISDNAVTKTPVTLLEKEESKTDVDLLTSEEPLEIRLAYTDHEQGRIHRSISVTMRTPGNENELAAGFLFTEGIIVDASQITAIDTRNKNSILVELQEDLVLDLGRLQRHFYTTSSCGVCGKASLEALSIQTDGSKIQDSQFSISRATLYGLNKRLKDIQPIFRETGGIHASALFNTDGEFITVREDVGRHNAMDKLIGNRLLANDMPLSAYGILVSGRASFELMQKALMASCPLLVAIGAPSSLAVELAQEFDITLLGFLRDTSFNLYHDVKRVH